MSGKVLVCGGRDFADKDRLFALLDEIHNDATIGMIIHGACPTGADNFAGYWAISRGVDFLAYPVDHSVDGPWPAAGPRRNRRMNEDSKPDWVIAFDTGGNGTASMISIAKSSGVPVEIINCRKSA